VDSLRDYYSNSICCACGKVICTIDQLVELSDGTVAHAACLWKRRFNLAQEIIAEYQAANRQLQAEIQRLESGTKSVEICPEALASVL
jgi:hypothetical protein